MKKYNITKNIVFKLLFHTNLLAFKIYEKKYMNLNIIHLYKAEYIKKTLQFQLLKKFNMISIDNILILLIYLTVSN